jgi:hypothetical protein
MRKILMLAAVPAVLSVALVAPATAAKSSSATLTVSTSAAGAGASSQPTVGSSLVFSGCGYQPGVDVLVQVTSPTAVTTYGEVAGSDGCVSTADSDAFTAHDAGTYTAAAFQSSRRKADANLTFTVTN